MSSDDIKWKPQSPRHKTRLEDSSTSRNITMQSFAVLFVFACIAGSFGKPLADDDRCKTPDQLHGRMIVVSDSGVIIEMEFQSDNQQKAQRYVSKTYNMKFHTLLLYKTGLQYTVVSDGKYCHVSQIGQDFRPIAVPASAHLMGEGELAGEMEVEAYGEKTNDTAYMIFLAKESCTPAYVIGKAAGHTSLLTFLDTDTGVDADAFDIPAICANSSVASPNARRSPHPKVAEMKRRMYRKMPNSMQGGPWLKL